MLVETLARYLDGLDYGNFFDDGYHTQNNIFINTLPQEPNNIVAIYDTGGQGKSIGLSDTRRTVQILVRHEKQRDANFLAWKIHNALTTHNTSGFIFIDDRKMLVTSNNTPTFIGKDTNGLFEYSINFLIWTRDDLTY
jgi:hypothetical protein